MSLLGYAQASWRLARVTNMPFAGGCRAKRIEYRTAMETGIRALNALLMIVLPLALGACLARRYRVPWSPFGWGAVTFIGAQLVHLPLLRLLTQSLRGVVTGPFVIEHALLDGVSVYGSGHLRAPVLEGVLACFGGASVAIVFALRPPLGAASRGR
jgi:hypothetical protein